MPDILFCTCIFIFYPFVIIMGKDSMKYHVAYGSNKKLFIISNSSLSRYIVTRLDLENSNINYDIEHWPDEKITIYPKKGGINEFM